MGILLGLVGISVLIFVHELGHFLAAKWAGAPVKTFALGFDPTVFGIRLKLLSFKLGETEYVIGLIPFGGYVRAGDESEDQKEGSGGEFASQPPGKRAVIFAAGATMNLLFGFAAFAVAFGLGVSFQAPEVGHVQPGSPAWYAGIRPGDQISAIDGKRVEAFMDVAVAAALGGERERTISIMRNGRTKQVTVVPRVDPVLGMPTIGIQPSVTRVVARTEPDSSAAKAGLGEGEEILSARFDPSGRNVLLPQTLPSRPFVDTLSFLAFEYPGAAFALRLREQTGELRDVLIVSAPSEKLTVYRIGIKQESRCVQFVRPGSEAARLLKPGDVIATVNEIPVRVISPLDLAERFPGENQFRLGLERGTVVTLSKDQLFRWLWVQDIVLGPTRTTVLEVQPGSRAQKAGLRAGDRILAVGTTPVGHERTLEDHIGEGPVKLLVLREQTRREIVLPEGGELGITWDHRPVVGWVKPGSPAQEAGLRPGDRIVRLGGKAASSWEELVGAVQEAKASALRLTIERGDKSPKLLHCSVPPRKEYPGRLGIIFKEKRVTVRERNLAAACALGLKRTFMWIKRVLLTVVRLVRGEVAARNLQGPVGIVYATGFFTSYGFGTLLYFLALISINLGVLNLLPLPIFDGGHLLLLACEKIKGSPVNERLVQGATTVMLFLLLALAAYVTYNDILRIIL